MEALARAGCRLIQLRAKELTSGAFHEWALEGVERAQALGARVVINDRVDIALTTGADGVHLGQDDLSPRSARRILGPDAIIGFSTHSVDQAAEAEAMPVDYVAVGPVYSTSTKQTEVEPFGPQGVAQVRKVVHKPLVAIGGITLDNGVVVMESGADSLAVISALMTGDDLESTARSWMDKLALDRN
jgi:thiamine-phosphate pyrophosphorylase